MRWWTKCISMVIAKTASRNVAFKANVMSQAVLEAQSSFAFIRLIMRRLRVSRDIHVWLVMIW